MDRPHSPHSTARRFGLPASGEVRLRPETGDPPQRTPRAYRVCDGLTEALIYFMVVFTPWAYGTTEEWSVNIMTWTAYGLGVLLLAKWLIRWRTGFVPARWGEEDFTEGSTGVPRRVRFSQWLTRGLAVLTLLLLAYIGLGAWNARALYLVGTGRFQEFDAIRWLPHSYDVASTKQVLWMYSGLACFFWSLRDWLLGKGSGERRRRARPETTGASPVSTEGSDIAVSAGALKLRLESGHRWQLPDRLQRLLWVVCLNGALLGLEGILQRLSGTNKLLWMLQPRINTQPIAQFGPFAYRSNAAQYLNLVWPVCLGFWMLLRESHQQRRRIGARIGESSHVVLLPAAVIMASCPVISTSRGGAIISALSLLVCLGVVLRTLRRENRWLRFGIVGVFAAIVALSVSLGWEPLSKRMRTLIEDQMSQRTEIYENALPIARDFPLYGTGAGTFGSVYQLYRQDPSQKWAAYLHDDWLETLVTLGWVGFGLVLLMLAALCLRAFGRGGIQLPVSFLVLLWTALGGCLLHAKFDFPFQIYSVLFLFLLLCAVQSAATPRFVGRG